MGWGGVGWGGVVASSRWVPPHHSPGAGQEVACLWDCTHRCEGHRVQVLLQLGGAGTDLGSVEPPLFRGAPPPPPPHHHHLITTTTSPSPLASPPPLTSPPRPHHHHLTIITPPHHHHHHSRQLLRPACHTCVQATLPYEGQYQRCLNKWPSQCKSYIEYCYAWRTSMAPGMICAGGMAALSPEEGRGGGRGGRVEGARALGGGWGAGWMALHLHIVVPSAHVSGSTCVRQYHLHRYRPASSAPVSSSTLCTRIKQYPRP